jgi:hypothetical protein
MRVDGSRMALKLKVGPPLQITETIDALYRPLTSLLIQAGLVPEHTPMPSTPSKRPKDHLRRVPPQ